MAGESESESWIWVFLFEQAKRRFGQFEKLDTNSRVFETGQDKQLAPGAHEEDGRLLTRLGCASHGKWKIERRRGNGTIFKLSQADPALDWLPATRTTRERCLPARYRLPPLKN